MRKMIAACGIGLATLLVAACGTTRTVTVTKTVPGPTVTVTVPGPTVTKTVAGPTVTKTAQPAVLMTKTFSGSGQWNSPEFTLKCSSPAVKVTYRFSGNTNGFGGDNFMADLQSPSGDDQQIANTIATSGGKTTTVYPDTSFGGSKRYYLSVQADGSWKFTLSETCG